VIPLNTKVDKGSTVWETAAFAVGHHRGSANPGELGNLVLSGHISSLHEGAVFKRLPEIKVGDGVIVATALQHFVYVAREVHVVKPSAIEVLNPTANAVATLITCVPDGVYSHRLVIRCDAA
jgi:sortase A